MYLLQCMLKSDHCGMETNLLQIRNAMSKHVKIRPLWDGNNILAKSKFSCSNLVKIRPLWDGNEVTDFNPIPDLIMEG